MKRAAEKRNLIVSLSPDLRALLRHRAEDETIAYPLKRRASIKDIIEAMGIPHTEVGRIRADGRETDFGFIPEPGQVIQVSEAAAPFDVTRPSRLRPAPLPAVRFVVDVNVGRLAALLRVTGFDAAYENGLRDRQIARLAHEEQRIVLSKDRALLKRRKIVFGRLVRSVQPDDQLKEILWFFGLAGPYKLFTRCLLCNRILEPVEKEAILHRLEPKTKQYFNTFKICPGCSRIYWQGSHCDAMAAKLERSGFNQEQ